MRILYFVAQFPPLIGGVEVISGQLVAELARRGHELVVVTSRDGGELPARDTFHGVEVRRLPILPALRTRDAGLLSACIAGVVEVGRELRPQVVNAHFTGPAILALPRRIDAALVLSCHGSWPIIEAVPDGLLTRIAARADRVTACSRSALEDLARLAPAALERTTIILNGLDLPRGVVPVDPPAGPPALLCAGRLVEAKRIDVAISALALLASRRPDLRLVIAGDGPERLRLERLAQRLEVADRAHFSGWVLPERIHELMAESSIVLVPSQLEGFGLVALEAALMTRPVVASDVGGLPEVVVDRETGLLVAPVDPPAMAAAILRLVEDPPAARAMGRAARGRALAAFSGRRHADDWEALYVQMVRQSADGR